MKPTIASAGFAAVGSAPRLEILRILVRSGDEGLPIGEIQSRTEIPASTLSHHLKSLIEGGVIHQQKRGTTVINFANFSHLRALADYLLDECCVDVSTPKELENV